MIDRWDPLPGCHALVHQHDHEFLSSKTLEERQHMARLKQQVNIDKKNVAECSNPFTGGPTFTRPRERNEKVPETSSSAFVYSGQTTAPSNSQHQVPKVEARYDRDYKPLSLERQLLEESIEVSVSPAAKYLNIPLIVIVFTCDTVNYDLRGQTCFYNE